MPISEAMTPIASIRATGCFSPSRRGSVSGGPLAVSCETGSLSLTARTLFHGPAGVRRAAAQAARRPFERRKAEGGAPWLRRKAFANCAACR